MADKKQISPLVQLQPLLDKTKADFKKQYSSSAKLRTIINEYHHIASTLKQQ